MENSLPNCQAATVSRAKIVGYLLSPTHPAGRHKAAFFTSFGFNLDDWERLAEALAVHASAHPVTHVEESPFGTRYVVEGIIQAPDGRSPAIRSVWFIETGESAPRFVTAYPLKESHDAERT